VVAKFKATGDERYFAVLFERYRTKIYSLGRAILGEAMAEDLLQETFVRAFEEIARFDERDPACQFYAWLRRICKNACVDELRKWRVRDEYEAESNASRRWPYGHQPADTTVSMGGGTYHPQELRAIFQQLDEELAKLPEERRLCWQLFYEEG